jgi:hypothetical protein
MSRLMTATLLLAFLAAGGCGTQDVLLGAEKGYLFTAYDAVSPPGEPVELRARLQAGDLLSARSGYVVRFLRDGRIFKAAETDADGVAAVTFTPSGPDDYRFTVEVSPNGFPDQPPSPVELLVACRAADTPLMVVDLDKTLVASGFQDVLIGSPQPMPQSQEVMKRLAERYSVVYLTHRPDLFGPRSKAWLREYAYPAGPLLLSDIGGFLKGSEAFKSRMLRELGRRFKRIEIGIGDKVSDAEAYHDNGIQAFLIIQPDQLRTPQELRALSESLAKLPEAVQVVTGWDQVEKAVFAKASFPRSRAQQQLNKLAEAMEPKPPPAGK